MDFLKKLEEVSEEEAGQRWEGTFRDFLDLCKNGKYPNIGILAHQRVYRMIMSHGTEKVDHYGDERLKYRFFEESLFGIEESIDNIMQFIHSAAQRTEPSRRLLLLYGPPSSGKCLSGDTLIYDAVTGRPVQLSEIVNSKKTASVYAVDEKGKSHARGIVARHSNGIQQTYQLTTSLGHEIKATANHRFLTDRGWVPVEEMQADDRIAVTRYLPEPLQIVDRNLSEVRFAAYMITEGNCRKRVGFSNSEQEIKDEFIEDSLALGKQISTVPISAKLDGKFCIRVTKEKRSGETNPLIEWLKDHNLWNKLSIEKTMCDFVFSLPNNSLAVFFGRLFSCDGNVGESTVNYYTSSKVLGSEVQYLLRRFGIVASLRYKSAGYCCSKTGQIRRFDSWRLAISDPFSVRNFARYIAPHLKGQKYSRFQALWSKFGTKKHKSNIDTFPADVRHVVKTEMKKAGLLVHARNYREPGEHFLRTDRSTRRFSREKLSALAERIESPVIQALVDSDIVYDKVVGIENSEVTEVFDIEIPRVHNFVANGIITHNSDFVTHIKRGLEDYTRTQEGTMFAIKGSPMHENPFLLIPDRLRDEFRQEYKVHIEGQLCPLTQYRLEQDYQCRFMDVPIEQIFISEAKRVGIGTWLPSDPKGQDISELVGGIDYAKLQKYGSEADPNAYNFDGELCIANRGVMEYVEGIKAQEQFLRANLTATQEKVIKAPRFGLIYVDEMILMHCNETEFDQFMAEKKNEAYHDRMYVVPVPYNLSVANEEKIYQKLLVKSDALEDMHIAPHTLEVSAIFAVLSRLEHSDKEHLLKKMKLYNKEHVRGHKLEEVAEMRKKSPREGMTGVSPRFVIDQIANAISKAKNDGKDYVTALDLLRQLNQGIRLRDSYTDDEKTRYEEFVSLARDEFNNMIRNDIQKGFFLTYDDEARQLCETYLDNIEAALADHKVKDPETGEEKEVNTKLIESIEDQIGISGSGRNDFRNEILRAFGNAARKSRPFDYTEHSQLKEAIQKQLFHERHGTIRMTVSSRNPEPEALRRINGVIDRMCEQQGYTEASANAILKYASSHLFEK